MLSKDFIPSKPFDDFKWKWACLQCTEGLNDPVILLGVLSRMRKLEKLNQGIKYSSPEFSNEMKELSFDTADSIGIDLAGRTGERNLIRNSGQYWKALNLIETQSHSGIIQLTDFGRQVADKRITKTEFSALTIQSLSLPNPRIQSANECNKWRKHKLHFYPLRLLLQILCQLENYGQGYITVYELVKIIIPLSGNNATIEDYVNFILWHREGKINLQFWPDCAPKANDLRIAREFLLFLENYGYLDKTGASRLEEKYSINPLLIDEVRQIINAKPVASLEQSIINIQGESYTEEFERKRVTASKNSRPNQARFRHDVLEACKRCIITNVEMPEILEAAHIKPFKYHGEDTIANGFAMRTDIHLLFDTDNLRITPSGDIELSSRARMDYGAIIPPHIVIPSFINTDFLKWRYDNYKGI